MNRFFWFALVITAFAGSNPSTSAVADFPEPSGPFAVGRVAYDWTDSHRVETLSKVPNARREILVDFWYPATPPKRRIATAYFPDAARINESSFAQAERNNLGKAWELVVADEVHAHIHEKVPIAAGRELFPFIIFSPALCGEPFLNTYQIQELVSHGYIVATIHHTYEVTVTVFPDGRMIPCSEENLRGQDAPTIEGYVKWEKERMDVWAGDIRFVLDQITKLNAADNHEIPFAGRLDLHRVGTFGHSFGGLAAARACALDQRFAACLNEDGVGKDGPIPLYGETQMPAHPFMFLRAGSPRQPTNKDAIEQESQIENAVKGCTGPAYQAWIEAPGFRHNSFTDIPFLLSAGNAHDRANALNSMRVVELYMTAFFDKFLKGARETVLDQLSGNNQVTIRRYHL